MKLITNLRLAGAMLVFAAALNANAESFASSSVSSAGSASSGSVSA